MTEVPCDPSANLGQITRDTMRGSTLVPHADHNVGNAAEAHKTTILHHVALLFVTIDLWRQPSASPQSSD